MFTSQTRVKNLIRYVFLEDNNAVMTERGYAEALKAEFDMEIQSEAFEFNDNLSKEVSTCEYQNKDQNDVSN